jgi:hypothetical protein
LFTVKRDTFVSALYLDGSSIGTNGASPGALENLDVYLLALNSNGTPTFGGSYLVEEASIGGTLSDTDVANLSSRINAYRAAVGAP